jgi:hypothetical protein
MCAAQKGNLESGSLWDAACFGVFQKIIFVAIEF